MIERLKETYRSEQRWEKAIQHMRDAGTLTDSPKDIGPLLNEVRSDVKEEGEAEIADILFRAFWPQIERGLVRGLPEWYKQRLAEQQFGG